MMNQTLKIRIFDIVGEHPIWVATDEGQKVYEKIVEALKAGYSVDLSFANHEVLITAFLNSAIGQLYNGEFDEEFLAGHLTYSDVGEDDLLMIEQSVENAKRYFANQSGYNQAWQDVLNDDEPSEE